MKNQKYFHTKEDKEKAHIKRTVYKIAYTTVGFLHKVMLNHTPKFL